MKSRDRIINAAIPVFAGKGRHGAHMEEIASQARINKAMIYYIFHSKDELYREVLLQLISDVWNVIFEITDDDIKSGKGTEEVVSTFISASISFFSENRAHTKILVDALSSGAEEIPFAIQHIKTNFGEKDPSARLREVIEKGKSEKSIRDVDSDQLIISLIGMVIIHFFSQGITQILDIEVEDESRFLEQRKKSIIDLVLNSILIGKPDHLKKKTSRLK